MSLRDASKISRVSHAHIRDIEDGRSIPSFEMVMKLLKAYMADIGEFLKQTGYLPPNVEPVRESKRLRVISWTQAGNWQQICDTSQYGEVLVIDDEEMQREIACGLLTKLGYSTEAVSSGEEAIEYLKEHSVDLIVLDMIMPKGLNGRETYEEVVKIAPHQKAIIVSGYAETEEVKAAQKLGAGKYIKKPYTIEQVI